MDRLETFNFTTDNTIEIKFTFQYGQIRNFYVPAGLIMLTCIYIPVWIDQKQL